MKLAIFVVALLLAGCAQSRPFAQLEACGEDCGALGLGLFAAGDDRRAAVALEQANERESQQAFRVELARWIVASRLGRTPDTASLAEATTRWASSATTDSLRQLDFHHWRSQELHAASDALHETDLADDLVLATAAFLAGAPAAEVADAQSPAAVRVALGVACRAVPCDEQAHELGARRLRQDAGWNAAILSEPWIAVVLARASTDEAPLVRRVLTEAAEAGARLPFAGTEAVPESEACALLAASLPRVLELPPGTTADGLLFAFRCAQRLGASRDVMQFLQAARALEPDDDRVRVAHDEWILEEAFLNAWPAMPADIWEDMQEDDPSHPLVSVLPAARALRRGEVEKSRKEIAKLPRDRPTFMLLHALSEYWGGNAASASTILREATARWRHPRLLAALAQTERAAGALEASHNAAREAFELDWVRYYRDFAATGIVTGDRESMKRVLHAMRFGRPGCAGFPWRARVGDALDIDIATEIRVALSAGVERFRQTCSANSMPYLSHFEPNAIAWPKEQAGPMSGWKLSASGICSDRVLESSREAHEKDPDRPGHRNDLAWCLATRGEHEEPLKLMSEVEQGVNGAYDDTIARILLTAGRADEAIAMWEELLPKFGWRTLVLHLVLGTLIVDPDDDSLEQAIERAARRLRAGPNYLDYDERTIVREIVRVAEQQGRLDHVFPILDAVLAWRIPSPLVAESADCAPCRARYFELFPDAVALDD